MSQNLPGARPGQRIQHARKHRTVNGEPARLTQEQAGALVGYTGSTWRKWENGELTPSVEQWAAIARVLNTDMNALMGYGHAVGPEDLPEHRAVRAVLHAMTGIYTPAEYIDPTLFAEAVTGTWGCWQGNSPVRHDLVGDELPTLIASGEAAVRATEGEARRDIHAARASLYQLTWSFLRGVGSPELGLIAAERSRRAAEDTDRPSHIAAATWGQAAILSSARQTEAALALCRKLIASLEPDIHSAPRDVLAVFGQAHLLASVQAVRLCKAELGHDMLAAAARVAALTGETNAHHTAFGPLNVLMHRTTAATEDGRYRHAIAIASQIDTAASPSVERRIAHRVNLAHAYASARDNAAALAVMEHACADDAAEVRSLSLGRATAWQLAQRRSPSTARQVDALLDRLQLA